MNKFWMNKVWALLLPFVSTLAVAGTGDALSISPFSDWKQIRTEHFRLVFPAKLAAQAERTANLYEQAHADLKVDLQWEAAYRVNVLLVDNADAANGMTTPVSRFGMILYLTPPDSFFSTDAYDDWLKLLVYHEYTHFLNMDATRGFWEFTRYLFGDVLLPNSTWPAWMLEGYAVYIETKYTRTGRGRSPYWDGILRTIVEENALDRSDTITLDEVNGGHPHFPSGEIPYLFGYHLMNTAERSKKGALGELTFRGSSRFPYFINGNVENVTGRDWYAHWDDWVAATNTKMNAQLTRLKNQPISKTERLDDTRDSSFGVTFSPDGRWVAYSIQNEDRWQTLRLREWKPEAKPKNIEDKFLGSSLAFTADSKRVLYSSLHRSGNYNLWTDLRVHELETGKQYWLTDDARARDPDVSKDGALVTYTVASDSGTDLMLGNLVVRDGKLRLAGAKKIVDAPPYDRLANPRFTPDGKGVVFAWKVDGKSAEDLRFVSLTGGPVSTLYSDGFRNRFPAFGPKGVLYFISDRTGIDNLFRLDHGKGVLVTNVTGGLSLPTFRGEEVYASSLSKDGLSIAKVETFSGGIDPAKVSVKVGEEAPAPAGSAAAPKREYPVESYSALATLLPRQWAPIYLGDVNSNYLGAEVFGYDNTFQHQYVLLGAFDTTAQTFDYAAQYENRSFGPTLRLFGSDLTRDVQSVKTNLGGPATFTREFEAGANLSFPFQQISSVFTPHFGASLERDSYFMRSSDTNRVLSRSRVVPRQDILFDYSATRSSRAGIRPERGSLTQLGARRYDLGARDTYKGIFRHAQYFHLGGHTVFSPSVRAMKVDRRDSSYLTASALNRGKRGQVIEPFYSDDFDEFSIRGYPGATISSREAITLGADLDFPIAQIFRGWGTNPFFVNQFWMSVFAEDTYRPSATPRFQHLASAGAGLRVSTEALLVLPLTLGVDYHYGFNKDVAGTGEVFFSITAASLLPF